MNDDNDDTTTNSVDEREEVSQNEEKTVGTNFFLVGPANGGGLP